MKLKNIIIIIIGLLFLSGTIISKSTTSFLVNGTIKNGKIKDLSSNTLRFEYIDGEKIHKNKIWLINFVNDKWDFPNERKQLNNRLDTIILTSNKIIFKKIVDYSSRKNKFEFQDGSALKVFKIKRVYFCCTNLPIAFKDKIEKIKKYSYTTFMENGTFVTKDIKSFNNKSTIFVDGLQVNTKDIIMINFENNKKDFENEKKYFQLSVDTLILKDGKVIQKLITVFDVAAKSVKFHDNTQTKLDNISRVYFRKQLKNKLLKTIKFSNRKHLKNSIKERR